MSFLDQPATRDSLEVGSRVIVILGPQRGRVGRVDAIREGGILPVVVELPVSREREWISFDFNQLAPY